MALYEIRQYEIRPGKMAAWVEHFDTVVLPFQVARGMVVAGAFQGETDDSVFFWIRRFESEEHRAELYDAVYGSETWKTEISPVNADLIFREKIVVNRVVPTAMSVLR